ncbi:hypothetical protein EGW08_016199 [Elysia chlorotica]|uniref:DnaJ homolog subfamily C member 22 n=1 Tax=Elysia chlorotica TaxID=188477 RepID=A0A433T396_ELYCH|nr:hypothetical protein EGW08_016199 [Elysia chlorotica]
MASQAFTYLLWLFGGWTGIHHVYLGRCNQALAYFVTFGGGFGLGWMRDLFRIPDYVKWENGDKEFQKRHFHRMAANPQPGCSMFRSAGMFALGVALASVLCGILPTMSSEYAISSPWIKNAYLCATAIIIIVGSSLGVYLVANIGELECSILYPLGGACLTIPYLMYNPASCTTTAAAACILTYYKGLRWRPMNDPLYSEDGKPLKPPASQRRRRGHCANFSMYFFFTTAWICLIAYGVYFNGEITVHGGQKIPVREAISNFFKSEAWKKTKNSLYQIFEIYKQRGFWQAYEDLTASLDLFGERAALKVVGLEKTATQEEITKRCRQLSRDNHPDLYKVEAEKEEAQKRFIEIQEACGKLSSIKTKRARQNRRENA